MTGTNIEVELDTRGAAAAGVDLAALQANVQAEIEKLADELKQSAPAPKRVPPPEGAQGADQLVHWLMHIAAEPAMVKIYVRIFIFAINEIAIAARDAKNRKENTDENFVVRITALGKEIALPAAVATIEAILDDTKGS